MEVYNGTGKTKTDELRITKAIGAFLITSSKAVQDLKNERITVFIERPSSDNTDLMSNVSLKHFILGATFGEESISSDSANSIGLSALCEITDNGAIELAPNESIKVQLTGLTPSATYSINGIEYPEAAEAHVLLERKTILTDQISQVYNVQAYDIMMLDTELVTDIEFTFSNGVRTNYSLKELKALAYDLEGIITVDAANGVSIDNGNVLTFPLEDVVSVDIEKNNGTVELTLLNL
jgi:hypothetical protein